MTDGDAFLKVFQDLKQHGRMVSPRGQKCLELEDYSYTLPPYVRFCNFTHRKLKLPYVKREFLWYLNGDPRDLSILEHAKMWKDLVNHDGTINSNYGQYIFGLNDDPEMFDVAAEQLRSDPDSRRASISILNNQHLKMDTKDVPCTYSINFRIRDNQLKMSVQMRSQDAWFGMGNDAPCFSFIHEMMLETLKADYPDLQMGTYHHFANSFHVYERHFKAMEALLADPTYVPTDCPRISGFDEVDYLRTWANGLLPPTRAFSTWLLTP